MLNSLSVDHLQPVCFGWVFVWRCFCGCAWSPCDPSSSAPGLKPHVQGTGAAGGRARVGSSLDSTPRGVWRRKTPISKTNDVPIAHTNTQIVYREPGGRARRHTSPAEGCVSVHFRSGDRRWRGCRYIQFHKSACCLYCWLHTKKTTCYFVALQPEVWNPNMRTHPERGLEWNLYKITGIKCKVCSRTLNIHWCITALWS